MDREILFRGKRMDNGEWVEGSYMEHYYSSRFGRVSAVFANDDVLCKTYRIPVDPSTVGQYTGLTDKDGKKIFEGDIVRFPWELSQAIDTVIFRDGGFTLTHCWWATVCDGKAETIGNIHDNPELIGGEGDG